MDDPAKSINDYGATDIPIATKWKPIAIPFYENWQLWKCMHIGDDVEQKNQPLSWLPQ